MHESVVEVGRVAEAEGIDAHYARGGTISLARNEAQLTRARELVEEERRLTGPLEQLDLLSKDEAERVAGATRVLGGTYTPHCAALHPLRLVRGLARCVEERGVSIFERTAASSLGSGELVTSRGTVRADVVVRATEGYTASLRGERRRFVPLYSLMIATEPLPPEAWEQIGLRRRETFADLRHMRIYGQRTADDRLAFGGRGAPYHFASRTRPQFDRNGRVHSMLREVLVDLFPAVDGHEVTHSWGGAIGVPRDWHASVGFDRERGFALGRRLRGRRRGDREPRRPHARAADHRSGERAHAAAVGGPPLTLVGARAAPLARRERRPPAPHGSRPRGGPLREARPERQGLRALHRLLSQWFRSASTSSSLLMFERPSMPSSAARSSSSSFVRSS